MPDAASIAIVLLATVAGSLLDPLRRRIERWIVGHRLGRSLRLAVRREIVRSRRMVRETAPAEERLAA